jgi:hypothetical protein
MLTRSLEIITHICGDWPAVSGLLAEHANTPLFSEGTYTDKGNANGLIAKI